MVAATQINGFLIVSFSLTGFSRESLFVFFPLCVPGKLPQWLGKKREKRAVRKIPFLSNLL